MSDLESNDATKVDLKPSETKEMMKLVVRAIASLNVA
jgi:hypothetical protein